ncbi:MAG: OmpA family protein [Chitinophagaceae bacterium]|nr:OmpA family protein [Chitinophagaceae bacterium]
MKKFLLLTMVMGISVVSFCQEKDNTKGKALGFSFFLNDFQAASVLRSQGVVDLFKGKNFFNTNTMNPGVAFNYYQGLTKHIDFVASLGGSFLNYPGPDMAGSGNKFYLELNGQANFKLLSDHYWVTPYVDLGAGFSQYSGHYAAFLPTGVGLQVNFLDQAYLFVNSQYRIAITENASYHFYHSIGVAGTIQARKQPQPKVVEIPQPVVLDRDHDGVVDSLDRCPDVPGLAALNGCPDKDGDGIADIDDKCPDVAGLAKYQGCPIPDSDGDGINDEEDKCPNVAGVARYQGCPVPDSDGDGVNDEEDKCPHEVGPASNFGCPVIDVKTVEKVNKAAQNIFFNTGSFKLLPKSFTSLKDVVQIMKDNPSYKIAIDGYTDNTGNAGKNQVLSENRANSVKDYLVKNGVDENRITANGHGINDPVASNATAAGRAKNRRVEMKLTNY